jgi:hypothetical protein
LIFQGSFAFGRYNLLSKKLQFEKLLSELTTGRWQTRLPCWLSFPQGLLVVDLLGHWQILAI